MPALSAFREDGTEVQPGDTITMPGSRPLTFRAATRASNDAGTDGLISVTQEDRSYPDMYSRPFGLVVRASSGQPEDPSWESADYPGDIQRGIRGPGGFKALITPGGGWLIIDLSDGETVTSGIARDQEAAKQAITDWERGHGLIPETGPSGQPEPSPRGLREILADLDTADHRTRKYRLLRDELETAVRDALTPVRGGTDALAAEADRIAQTMAPPVPGVTRNAGCVVYSVLEAGTAGTWYVAAMRESDGERVTWRAETCPDGTLVYSAGNYHTRGQGSADEALADLALRAGVFGALDRLSSGAATREAYRESYEQVLAELSGVYDVGRARVRSGLLEAAALGYARISWHSGGTRSDYGIRYDRYRCVFTYHREH